MDQPLTPTSLPKITRTFIASCSSSHQRILSDDLFSNLTPETTLKAITTPSGHLKDRIEAATPNERAFGLRAADASKKIHKWAEELLGWPWPKGVGLTGFEMSPMKNESREFTTASYIYNSGLLESQISLYEKRIEEIYADLEILDMNELKRQILDTHFSPRSSPSQPFSKVQAPSFISTTRFNEIDDFTALVTATVLQTLPTLNKLIQVMELWNIRLAVLRRVPDLMLNMDDAEVALKSGWNAIRISGSNKNLDNCARNQSFSKKSFDIIRNVLEEKVTNLGKEIDLMLDTLEATHDTVPEQWLDRMENLEQGYSDWVVAGDCRVRDEEWAISEKAYSESQVVRKLESTITTAENKDHAERGVKPFKDSSDPDRQDPYKAENASKKSLKLASHKQDRFPPDLCSESNDQSQEFSEHNYSSLVEAARRQPDKQFDVFPENSLRKNDLFYLDNPNRAQLYKSSEVSNCNYVFCNSTSNSGPTISNTGLNENIFVDDLSNFISSAKLYFYSSLGKEFSLKVPLDGSTIYTSNSALISKIYTNVHSDVFYKIKTVNSTQTLIEGSPGIFILNPPQNILSISCLPMTSIELETEQTKTKNHDYSPNFTQETSHKIGTAKIALSEKLCVRSSRLQELPLRSSHELGKGKMSPVLEETRALSCIKAAGSICEDHNTQQEDANPPTNKENLPLMNSLQNSSPLSRHQSMSTLVSNCGCTSPKDVFCSVNTLPNLKGAAIESCHELRKKPSIIGHIHSEEKSYDISPTNSPLDSHSVRIYRPRSVSFGPDYSGSPNILEAAILRNVDVSPSPKLFPIKITRDGTDEQIQQRISSLLESISARICLSPDSDLVSQPIKPRKMLTRSTRSTSSLSNHGSSRASTPSFTLAPVYSKGVTRPRRQHNSEIRVYHLSCSTGEAPIKLFVRLVGENGERVMVRVGGGWADLGEYLKEYASHHGHRVNTDTIKVQDAPLRTASGSSTTSGTIIRPNARTKLLQTPQVVSDPHRSKGNLNVQKVRKSFSSSGSAESLALKTTLNKFRSPSTPLPAIKHTLCETPPSGASSNGTLISIPSGRSSRMSWNEDDFNLGLAGPRGKSNLISDHDQEWVESMKEKVRLASAEKDRRNRERADRADRSERERSRGYSFGELEKVRGTKRLFRREGSLF